jgi:uncharacterized protein YbjT (DUF2867 family)
VGGGLAGRSDAPRPTSPILVTGGIGTLGRLVVGRLRVAGRDVRVLTRRGRPAEDGVAPGR